MPVVDTNVLIHAARRDPRAAAALERCRADGPLLVAAHAAMEFLAGADDVAAHLQPLRASFTIVHSTDELILRGAQLRQQARGLMPKPQWGDIHVAALASLNHSYVITTNKRHFTQLGVPAWHYEIEDEPPKT